MLLFLMSSNNMNQAEYDDIMWIRANDKDAAYAAAYPNRRGVFAFNSDAEVKNVFKKVWPEYDRRIFSYIPALKGDTAFANSKEYIACAAAAYLGVLGPKTGEALATNNRAEAWYELRYGWLDKDPKFNLGWAKRAYFVSAMLGLYDDPKNEVATEDEAKKTYAMLTTHRNEIMRKEFAYGDHPDGTPNNKSQINLAKSDYSGTLLTSESNDPESLVTALIPARKAFIEWLNTTLPSDKQFNAAGIDAINPAAIYYGGDNVSVQVLDARADDARTGNDLNKNILVGGSGSDILIGGKNDDVLVGRAGLDTYIQTTGDGNDTLIDSDRKGRIILNKVSDANANQAASIFIGVEDQANTWKSLDGALTLTQNGNWMLSFEGGSIDLGTTLNDGSLGIRRVDVLVDPQTSGPTIQGDRKLIDTNPNQADDQFDVDEYGNWIVGTEVEPDRADTLYDRPFNDYISSGGGDDVISTVMGGDNVVDAGSGRDKVYGGAGNDVVSGGTGADILQGGDGKDRLYAGDKITLAQALLNGNTEAGSNQKGDWLAGNKGDDILVGGADNDVLTGGGGSDLLMSGAGDDDILGDADLVVNTFDWDAVDRPGVVDFTKANGEKFPADFGADVIYAGNGNDHAWGGRGDDTLYGEGGNDYLAGNGDNDVLFGGDGADTLRGDAGEWIGIDQTNPGDDYLDGGAGNDILDGGDGDDILIGGAGNDYLDGGKGRDVYIFNKGDGVDYLVDYNTENNILRFGAGFDPKAVKLQLGSLLLDMGDGDQIHIENFDKNDALNTVAIGSFEFADGTTLSTNQLLERGFDIDGTDGDDILSGTSVADRMRGFGGNDLLFGGAGDDTLDGGTGNNLLMGGSGNDTYVIRTADVTVQTDPLTGLMTPSTVIDDTEGQSTIRLDALQTDVTLGAGPDGLGLTWGGGTAGIYIKGMGGHVAGTLGNSLIEFADGTQSTLRRLAGDTLDAQVQGYSNTPGATVFGGKQADTLGAYGDNSVVAGGLGDDDIYVGGQGTTVEYRRGDGVDTLGGGAQGTVVALQGAFNPDELRLEVDALGQLVLRLGGGDEERMNLGIYRDGLAQSTLIDRFTFDDGGSLSFADLLARGVKVAGTQADDVLWGTSASDQFLAGAGYNEMNGGAGEDSYVIEGGSGNRIDDREGANVIRLSGLTDWGAVQVSRVDEQSNDLLISVDDGVNALGTVHLTEALLRADKFSIALADGQTRTLASFIADLGQLVVQGGDDSDVILGSDQGNMVDGGWGHDQITGGAAADWLVGGAGDDVLAGGGAGDMLFGGEGDDSFVIDLAGAGAGHDQIFDYEGNNTVRFAAGVDPAQLVVQRLDDSTDVRISLDADRSVLLRRALEGAVKTYAFVDGTSWSYAELINRFASANGQVRAGDDLDNVVDGSSGNDLLLGNQGADVLYGHAGDDELLGGDDQDELYGGTGNDTLDGGAGLDAFHFALGDGVDRLVDLSGASTIKFGPGIKLQDLSASRETVGGESYVRLAYSANDALLIKEGVLLPDAAFQFDDGMRLGQEQLYARALNEARLTPAYTSGNDVIYGYAGNDVLQGGVGLDRLLGGAGNDVLDGGVDDDALEGGAGADTYVMGPDGGRDTVLEADGQNSTIILAQGDQTNLSYARMGANLLLSSTLLNTSFLIQNFYIGSGSWTLKTEQGAELDLRALAATELAEKTAGQRREDFYAGLTANAAPMDLGDGQVFRSDGSREFTDAQGNEFSYSFSNTRPVIESDDAVINASADASSLATEQIFLRTEEFTRTYEVTDVEYNTTQTVTSGTDYLYSGYGSFGGSVYVPPSYSTYIDSTGALHLVEPSRTITTRTPVYTTRTVTETYEDDLYRTEVSGQSQVEDVRGGEQANTMYLSGTASKLVSAGGGDDLVVRADSGGSDRLGEVQAAPADWVDGGAGNDQIRLGAGHDELSGGSGSDYLDGGAGADTYVVSADDDGWDVVYDSAAATVRVHFEASQYGSLDQSLADQLGKLMTDAVRGYSQWPSVELISLSGNVTATAENLNALMAIDRARPAKDLVPSWWEPNAGRSTLVSSGLDSLIASATNSPLMAFGLDPYGYGAEVLRPEVSFTDEQVKAFQNTATDTVRFGAGVSLANLQLAWGTVELDEGTKDVLNVSWGGTGGVRVVMPDADAPPGVGIEQFEFADGTRMSLDAVLALVPPRPVTDDSIASGAVIEAWRVLEDQAFEFALPADAFVLSGNKTVRYSAKLAGSDAPLPSWLSFDSRTGTFSGAPGNSDVGVLNVEVTARQSATLSATQTFTLNVANVNDAPEAAGVLDGAEVNAGEAVIWSVPSDVFTDQDVGDFLSYRVEGVNGEALPAWLQYNTVKSRLEGIPGSVDVGTLQLRLVATDLYGAQAIQEFALTVIPVDPVQIQGTEGNDVLTGGILAAEFSGLGGNDVITGTAAGDLLDGGEGDDRLEGGAGRDTYLFAHGAGHDTLVETDATAGVRDVLLFGGDIAADQIWLRQLDNHLEISLLGSGDKVTVANWYLGADRHIEVLQLADGRQLLDTQVQNLVQAMAAFAPPAAGQTTLPQDYASTLNPVIAANWQ